MSPWLPGGLGGGGWCGLSRPGFSRSSVLQFRGWGSKPLKPGARQGVIFKAALGATAFAAGGLVPHQNGGSMQRSPSNGFGSDTRRMTDLMLLLNAGVFVANFALGGNNLLAMGAKVNSAIIAGQWYRLFTASLLHGGIIHLLVNCFSLNNIGPPVEAVSGRERFLCIYTGAAFAGGFASFCFNSAPSVGASGAVFGLGGALAVFYYRHREILGKHSDVMLQQLRNTLIINLMFGLLSRNIDNWGHIGGLLGGAAVAWLLGPNLVEERQLGGKKARLVDRPPVPIFAYRRPAGSS